MIFTNKVKLFQKYMRFNVIFSHKVFHLSLPDNDTNKH